MIYLEKGMKRKNHQEKPCSLFQKAVVFLNSIHLSLLLSKFPRSAKMLGKSQMSVTSREEGSERSWKRNSEKDRSNIFSGYSSCGKASLWITSGKKKSRKQSKKIPALEEQIRWVFRYLLQQLSEIGSVWGTAKHWKRCFCPGNPVLYSEVHSEGIWGGEGAGKGMQLKSRYFCARATAVPRSCSCSPCSCALSSSLCSSWALLGKPGSYLHGFYSSWLESAKCFEGQ